MAKSKVVALAAEIAQKLSQWNITKQQLTKVKEEEFALRTEVVNGAGFKADKFEGSETLALAGPDGNDCGWRLKVVKDQNYTLTNEDNKTVNLLNELGKSHPEIASNLVRWKPELSESVYKKQLLPLLEQEPKLMETVGRLLAEALTIKPGAPQLELIPPKAEESNGQ